MAEPESARLDARPSTVLDIDSLDVRYGAVQVLFGTCLRVEQGEALALLGTNGAGKSTLLKAISGLVPVRAGVVAHLGEDITSSSAESRVGRSIVLVSGGQALFRGLSVSDNLKAGAFTLGRNRALYKERVGQALDLFPGLKPLLGRQAGLLSGGEQQMLAIAKATMLAPRLLLIDELSLGLAPIVVAQLIDVVAALRASGVTLVIVEQSLNVALHLAERAVFMEKGVVKFEGSARELQQRDDIARAVFLGGHAA